MAARNYQFRLIVRPTVVGEEIIARLEAQGVDRTAESRRWLELGFAAEQAGFRLDGSQLRYADRAWETQPRLAEQSARAPAAAAVPQADLPATGSLAGATTPTPTPAPEATSAAAETPPTSSVASSQLRGNLRGLSAS